MGGIGSIPPIPFLFDLGVVLGPKRKAWKEMNEDEEAWGIEVLGPTGAWTLLDLEFGDPVEAAAEWADHNVQGHTPENRGRAWRLVPVPSSDRIRALQRKATEAGDPGLAATCRLALEDRDPWAVRACERALR